MPFLRDEFLNIGRVESVVVKGRQLEVVLKLAPAGAVFPPELENPRSIIATVDDVARTPLRVRKAKLAGDSLRLELSGLPAKSRRVSIRIAGLIPGRDTATISLVRDAPPFDPEDGAAPGRREAAQHLISYLFKDFNSFRRLMLDSLSHDMPEVVEQHEGDVVVAAIEVLAFAADQLSYFQDGVATEAYLETARRRVSVRRHARLINYAFHEGCTPRTWLQIAPEQSIVEIASGFPASTPMNDAGERCVYETLEARTLYACVSEMTLWDYGDAAFTLRRGSTAATIVRTADPALEQHGEPLRKNTVLIFEQRRSVSGAAVGAQFRQAVRLTKDAKCVAHPQDPRRNLCYIEWSQEDALLFDLPARTATTDQAYASFVLGNIVAADFGETIHSEVSEGLSGDGALRFFAPQLTCAVAYDSTEPASVFTDIRPYHAVPAITLSGTALGSGEREWRPRADLIGADPYERVFTVEPEANGGVLLRFGDGVNGTMPDASTRFEISWRQGNGSSGRVGPDAVTEFDESAAYIARVRNPLASGGGYDPLELGTVKRQAPALARRQRRCITDDDYVQMAESIPGVTAAVRRRWTGSGETVDVFVYAEKGAARTRARLLKLLQSSSAIGMRVAVREPQRVGVVVKLAIRFNRGANPNEVLARVAAQAKAALDVQNVSMGKALYASWFVTAATNTLGVAQATIVVFRRLDGSNDIEGPVLHFAPTEVAVLVDEDGMVTSGRPLVVSA